MAIALRGTPTTVQSATTTLAVPVPTGTVSGDVLVVTVLVNSSSHVPATPTGLTLLDSGSTGPSYASYTRICDGTEPASYSFTVALGGAAGTGRSYSGVDNTTPVNAHGSPNRSTTSTATATTITTTVNGCELIFASGAGGAEASFTLPTGFANEAAAYNGTSMSCTSSDQSQATAGATGSVSGTWSGTQNNYSQVIALAPASGVSPPTNTVAPAVTGSATVGSTLTTDNGTWTGSPTSFTYQWTSAGVNISAATSSTYVTQAGDVGNAVGCTVTATNAGGSTSQASNTITVTAAPSLSTVVGKTGTSGTAVMQKAKSGWTYITGKKNTSGTAVDQKGLGGFTKIKGH